MKLALFMLLLPSLLYAQNLVPNHGFECGVNHCDWTTVSEFFASTPYACNWELPTHGTSDIFSVAIANKACWTSMPQSQLQDPINPPIGSQSPRSGARFAGIFTFNKPVDPSDTSSYREYLMVPLASPLEPGKYYCGEMYVSLAEQPKYAANNLGMYFSDARIRNFDWLPLIRTPQIVENKIILDTDQWVKVSGAFKATSPAQYLIIGNFQGNPKTTFKDKGGTFPQSTSYHFAYYFIDDVSVVALGNPAFTFNGLTSVCEGASTDIHASGKWDAVKWTTLADPSNVIQQGPDLHVKPDVTTAYRVTGSICSLEVTDTVTVTVLPNPEVNLGNDTTLCTGTTLTIDAGDGFANYTWQDNSSGRFLNVSQPGRYSVTTENSSGCKCYDEIEISQKNIPTVALGKDLTVCDKFPVLRAGGGQREYEWSTGASDSTILPDKTGEYWVRVKNECGEAADTLYIHSFEDIFIPNVVTINNDTLNGQFRVKGLREGVYGRLKIHNRWGSQIFFQDNYKNSWPPVNSDVPSGIYYYELEYPGCRSYKGALSLIRSGE